MWELCAARLCLQVQSSQELQLQSSLWVQVQSFLGGHLMMLAIGVLRVWLVSTPFAQPVQGNSSQL